LYIVVGRLAIGERRQEEVVGMRIAAFCLVSSLFFVYFLVQTRGDLSQVNYTEFNVYAEYKGSVEGINEIDDQGMTRLMLAAKAGQFEVVKAYVNAGSDVNLTQNSTGNMAIHFSTERGHYMTSDFLIKSNSELNHFNRRGYTPLLHAILGKHYQIAEQLLISHANPNATKGDTADGYTALMMAAQVGLIESVELLLKYNVDTDIQCALNGDTALMIASVTNQTGIVELLLSHNVSVDMRNDLGYTALSFAAMRGHVNVVKALVTAKANMNNKDIYGLIPLDHAIKNLHDKEHEDVANYLYAQGSNEGIYRYNYAAEAMKQRQTLMNKIKEAQESLVPKPSIHIFNEL